MLGAKQMILVILANFNFLEIAHTPILITTVK